MSSRMRSTSPGCVAGSSSGSATCAAGILTSSGWRTRKRSVCGITAKKNETDGVSSVWSHVPMSHMLALVVPVTLSVKQFLAEGASDGDDVEAMHQAWFKAVTV